MITGRPIGHARSTDPTCKTRQAHPSSETHRDGLIFCSCNRENKQLVQGKNSHGGTVTLISAGLNATERWDTQITAYEVHTCQSMTAAAGMDMTKRRRTPATMDTELVH